MLAEKTRTCATSALAAVLAICIAAPGYAQEPAADCTAQVDVEMAADLAEDLKAQAYSVQLDTATESGEKMQATVDQIGTVSTLLESELRAGKSRTETEPLYRELRRLRLEAIGMAMRGAASLPEGAAEVEALLSELGRYQRGEE